MNNTLRLAFLFFFCCPSCVIPVVIAAVMLFQCLAWIAVSSIPSMSPMSSCRPAPSIRRIGLLSNSLSSVASSRSALSPLRLFGFATCRFYHVPFRLAESSWFARLVDVAPLWCVWIAVTADETPRYVCDYGVAPFAFYLQCHAAISLVTTIHGVLSPSQPPR